MHPMLISTRSNSSLSNIQSFSTPPNQTPSTTDPRNEMFIDTWDPEPVAPQPFKRKPFSPITSDEEI